MIPQTIHRVAAGVVAACAILTAADVMPHEVTISAAIFGVLAHAVEVGIDAASRDQ